MSETFYEYNDKHWFAILMTQIAIFLILYLTYKPAADGGLSVHGSLMVFYSLFPLFLTLRKLMLAMGKVMVKELKQESKDKIRGDNYGG